MPPPRATVTGGLGTMSSTMSSTRARRDPLRRIGNGNAVADGIDMTRVGILSDRELAFFHRLAHAGSRADEQQQRDARKVEEERRRNLSKARTAGWTDTIEARHERFLQSQEEAVEAAEARQKILDDLYLEQRKEEHKAVIARQELEKIKEDPRSRHVRAIAMLHETLKAREAQIAYKDMMKQQEEKQNIVDQQEFQQQLWGDQAEKYHKKLLARQRNMEEKNTNLEAVLYQIGLRREERAADQEERKRIEHEAAEERAEQQEEDMARRAREIEHGEYNVAHSRTAVTKAQKLEARLAQNVKDTAELRAEEEKVEELKRWVREKQKKKQLAFEERKKASLPQYLQEAQRERLPTYRTQDVFEQRGTSFLQRLYDGDATRQNKKYESRLEMVQQRLQKEEEAAAEARGEVSSGVDSNGGSMRRHRAATTAAGFLSKEEEKAYAEEIRRYPEQLKAIEREESAARRAKALELEQAQKLQAAQKREKEQQAVEAHREEVRQQQAQQAADDARFRAYIDSVIPADMDPVLYRKAVQMH